MKLYKPLQMSGLLFLAFSFFSPLAFAQDEETDANPESATSGAPSGQEVEVNEDIYRQFMELKDARGQRNMLPENAFKPGSGTQKLDELPEASQKHLRNQLREIILQGDQWEPGDETEQYPYVPSAAASADSSLAEQEAEAWGELVDSYHQREAAIYENSARSQAAKAAGSTAGGSYGGAPGGNTGGDSGSGGGQGKNGEGQEANEQNNEGSESSVDSYSPNASSNPDATNAQGVSQNAMEFLKGRNQPVANMGASGNQAGASSANSAQGNQASQQNNTAQNQSSPERQNMPVPGIESKDVTQELPDSSQNALEYLTGKQAQDMPPPAGVESKDVTQETPDSSQNALEYLTGEDGQAGENEPALETTEGTLTIEALLNAQGVRNATGNKNPEEDDETDG